VDERSEIHQPSVDFALRSLDECSDFDPDPDDQDWWV